MTGNLTPFVVKISRIYASLTKYRKTTQAITQFL